MDRRHFELDRGYLNVDEDALYFTRSGNWQEALGTKEHSGRFSPRRAINSLFGILLVFSRAFFDVLHMPTRGPEGFLLSFGLAGLGLLVLYHALRHDLAPNFRIPWSKLISIEQTEKTAALRWLDGDGRERERTMRMPAEAFGIVHAMLRSRAGS
ncbi:MAG: hypothetical protein JNL52_03255 [Flavobacteriales bacterium]|nr:hypothetical protein [Flavobacteriales bacterium]